MKNIIKKIVLILTSVFALLSTSRRKPDVSAADAIHMPQKGDQIILEDFEMAAYHNHA